MPATYLLGISESCLLGLLGGSHKARWSDPRPFVNVIMNAVKNTDNPRDIGICVLLVDLRKKLIC